MRCALDQLGAGSERGGTEALRLVPPQLPFLQPRMRDEQLAHRLAALHLAVDRRIRLPLALRLLVLEDEADALAVETRRRPLSLPLLRLGGLAALYRPRRPSRRR